MLVRGSLHPASLAPAAPACLSALGPLPGTDGEERIIRFSGSSGSGQEQHESSWGALGRGCGTLSLRELGCIDSLGWESQRGWNLGGFLHWKYKQNR